MNYRKTQRYRFHEEAFQKSYNLQREEYFIAIDKYHTKVRVQVIGEGAPVLFIPGGPNAGTVWTQLVSLLPNYQCILLDRPGSGLGAPINYQSLTSQRLNDIIITVIDNVLDFFRFKKVALAGSSFGGYWTLKYALNRPERVTKLILEGCPAFIEGFIIPPFMKMMTRPLIRWLLPKLPTSVPISKKIMKDMGHAHAIENNLIPALYFRWYVSMCNHTITLKNELKVINRAMKGGKVDPQYFLRDTDITKITAPTLWLWGINDPFSKIETANRLNETIENSTLHFFENSGHLPWMDDPNTHARLMNEFLNKEI